jgi:hypothetical protein
MTTRKKTLQVQVGHIEIGGDSPIVVQSMTNTDTANVEATTRQIMELADAGSEIVRITVNNELAARAVPVIHGRLQAQGYHSHRVLQQAVADPGIPSSRQFGLAFVLCRPVRPFHKIAHHACRLDPRFLD